MILVFLSSVLWMHVEARNQLNNHEKELASLKTTAVRAGEIEQIYDAIQQLRLDIRELRQELRYNR